MRSKLKALVTRILARMSPADIELLRCVFCLIIAGAIIGIGFRGLAWALMSVGTGVLIGWGIITIIENIRGDKNE